MDNSYCGKNCNFCVTRSEGKCIGCKPEVHVPLHRSLYIADISGSKPLATLTDSSSPEASTHEEALDFLAEKSDGYKDEGCRFSSYCSIAMCCRSKNFESCVDCLKTYACEKYSKKGIMNTVIDSKMQSWGMIDHGLKKAVPFLYILLICLVLESFFSVTSFFPNIPILFFIVSTLVTGVRGYSYFRLRSFNSVFAAVALLTAVYIAASLFLELLNRIDYGTLGRILQYFALLIQLVASIICYKMSFDAYAELVSPIDYNLEKRWSKVWRLTIIIYIIAFVAALLSFKSLKYSGFILFFGIGYAILNIITFILMISTIKVCSND